MIKIFNFHEAFSCFYSGKIWPFPINHSAPGMEAAAHRQRGQTAAWATEAATIGADPVRTADVGRDAGGYSGQPGDTPHDFALGCAMTRQGWQAQNS